MEIDREQFVAAINFAGDYADQEWDGRSLEGYNGHFMEGLRISLRDQLFPEWFVMAFALAGWWHGELKEHICDEG